MRLGRVTVLRVLARSLFLQAGFNPESLQALGLVYALRPALDVLYPDPTQRTQVTEQYLATFNTHPYVSAAIVGGLLFHEERMASGEEAPGRADAFKRALMGPLAALGDGFFWRALLPACGALACAAAPWLGAVAAVVFLVAYNTVHLAARAWLFWLGYTRGDGLLEPLAVARVPVWTARLKVVALFAAAVCVGGVVGRTPGGWRAAVSLGALTLVAGLLARLRVGRYALLYGAAAAAVLGSRW